MKYVFIAALIACACLAHAYFAYSTPSQNALEFLEIREKITTTSTILEKNEEKAPSQLSFSSQEFTGYSSCERIAAQEKIVVSKNGVSSKSLQFENLQYEEGEEFFLAPLDAAKGKDPSVEDIKSALNAMHRAAKDSCADATRSLALEFSKRKIAFFTALSQSENGNKENEMHAFVVVRMNGKMVPIEPQDKDPFAASRSLERNDAAYSQALVFQYPLAFSCSSRNA